MKSWLTTHLRDGDCFWDIGANVGGVSALARGLIGQGLILAFEPNPVVAARIPENVEGPLSFFVGAVSSEDYDDPLVQLQMFTNSGTSFINPDYRPEKDTVPYRPGERLLRHARYYTSIVDPTTLYTLGFQQPDFLKVDVEGRELVVLESLYQQLGRRYAEHDVPCRGVIVETYAETLKYFDVSYDDICMQMESYGFEKAQTVRNNTLFLAR